ncbi:metalloregulator ArsR/SmtB family transcription factor [Paraburkholderia sp. CNPSo 3157]|uniref:Metalloregulator ArsR/SmtB family transcription factor n=1 Tax=Paraburkholderia franconis TaxID=2654983 RepID=A0A7X1TDT5_9BURK|nr:metalloregulator ArsR/SmtB family transcription factor [Paraburkholderia franconis]MPW15522.1 metalloregulator ArsR/SmtB family transcription factor [Paraburkholderia franconis]
MDSKSAVKALAALAQESRLATFRLLVTAGPVGMSAGAIAEALGLPSPSLSFHLKELSYAGLIEGRSQGRHVIYSASYSNMQALIDFLLENCCAAQQECGCASNATEA